MTDTLLIFGANGQVGKSAADLATSFGFNAVVLSREALDITNLRAVAAAAARPAHSVLNNAKISKTFGLTIRNWEAPIAETVAAVLALEESNA